MPSLDDRYTLESGAVFMSGVQALVRLLLDRQRAERAAGRRGASLVTGYQGSPLAGLDLELGRQRKRLAELDVVHQPAVNEEMAATAVMGSQLAPGIGKSRYDGVVGFWYGKAPGLDRAADAIRHANLVGVPQSGGAVAFVGDDAAAKSSTVPSSSEHLLMDLGMPILVPGDVEEILELGHHAVEMSQVSGLWTAMKIATSVADSTATIEADAYTGVRPAAGTSPVGHQPHAQLIGAGLLELERSQSELRLPAALDYGRRNALNRVVVRSERDSLGIVAVGRLYFELRQALADLGLDERALADLGIRLLKVAMPFPLDHDLVRRFAHGLAEIVVIEEKRPLLEEAVRAALYRVDAAPVIVGKRDDDGRELLPAYGDLDADRIARVVGSRLLRDRAIESVRLHLDRLESSPKIAPLELNRVPYFCSGCPHNSSTKVPDDAIVGGGIGCHGLGMVMDPEQVGDLTGVTQMGGEGAQWIGIAPFVDTPHVFQNLGDGTFMHSGSLAVRAAVAAGIDITYKLLFNSAVAMTGGQQPAGGGMSVSQICRSVLAEGVRQVIVTADDPSRYDGVDLPAGIKVWPRERLIDAQEALAAVDGVTMLIHDQECATEVRRKRKRGKLEEPPKRIFINERVCEGCGDCGEVSNCMSVQPVPTEFGRKTKIHQPSCNKDYSCVEGDCPSFIEVVPGRQARRQPPSLSGTDLPAPPPRTDEGETTVRVTGIGGTGIVSTAQIVAVAAHLDGRKVRGLDQIGLAQKGGPVVSDLRISTVDEPGVPRNGMAASDLYLGADLLVASEPRNLQAADPGRTVAVISTAEIPTGTMARDTGVKFPRHDRLVGRIAKRCDPERSIFFDAQKESLELFGSDQAANLLLTGIAVQLGALPVNPRSMEIAIGLNGVAVDMNVQAFRRGRQRVADQAAYESARAEMLGPKPEPPAPSAVAQEIIDDAGAAAGSELRRLLDIRVPELTAYQSPRYAKRYSQIVARTHAIECERVPGQNRLAEAVAKNAFKLMAYKDEAEVARLHLDPQVRAAIEYEFGVGARFNWKLHPPVFRALGLGHKIPLGEWFRPVYRLLYAMRHLRGTPIDPFGRAKVRRQERDLIEEYFAMLNEILEHLAPDNHMTAVTIASLPDDIRGYEEVKLRSIDRYRQRIRELQAALR